MLHSMEEMTLAGCTSRRGIRHWEDQGLLGGVVRSEGGTRRYDDDQLRRAKVIAAAQFGGFELETIKTMLDEYDNDNSVYEALMIRLDDQMRACVRLGQNLPKPFVPSVEYDL